MTIAASVHIANSFQKALDGLLGFLPNLLGFFLILIVGYFIARLVKGILTKVLEKVGVDKALHTGPAGSYVDRVSPGASPAALIAGVVFWFIFLFVLTAAISALKIPAVTAFMNQVLSYLPNVIAAVIIFVIAGVVAAAAGGAAAKLMGDTPTGKIVGTAVPALVMGIAVFMVLNQLKIAPAIVQITYVALLGSVALGAALAFGLGGRGVAANSWLRPTATVGRTRGRSSRTCRSARTVLRTRRRRSRTRRRTTAGALPRRPAGNYESQGDIECLK